MGRECDVCPNEATVHRPPTRNRADAWYCEYDGVTGPNPLGWGDLFHRVEDCTEICGTQPDYGGRFSETGGRTETMMHVLSRSEALRQLHDVYGLPSEAAIRTLAVADQHGVTAESCTRGTVTVRAMHNGKEQYQVSDGIPEEAVGKVTSSGYTSSKEAAPEGRSKTMPRGRAAAAPEPATEARDLSVYATKDPTAKMVDYHEWLESELGIKLNLQSVYVGVTLYPEFQKSDFNKERTAARRAERAAGNGTPAPAETPKAKPGRKPGGTTGKRGTPQPATAGKRGRGRPRKDTAAAPF